jgi:hypothetical protein
MVNEEWNSLCHGMNMVVILELVRVTSRCEAKMQGKQTERESKNTREQQAVCE